MDDKSAADSSGRDMTTEREVGCEATKGDNGRMGRRDGGYEGKQRYSVAAGLAHTGRQAHSH